jgi:protease II
MKAKLNWIINTAALMMVVFIAYKSFFPGREPINKDITEKVFQNNDLSKLFKIRDTDEKKYFFVKDMKTIEVYQLNDTSTKIKEKTTIPFEQYWFTVKKQGMETYLVLFSNPGKMEIKLFDNDIRPLSEKLIKKL